MTQSDSGGQGVSSSLGRVWQIAAGDGPERDYTSIFFRYGLAAVGPGDPGRFDENADAYARGTGAYRDFLQPFCQDLAVGDVLLLKRPAGQGRWQILGVGVVESKYEWEPRLGDVEGWDLQHCRRVQWRRVHPPKEVTGLVRGTLRRVHRPELQQLARRLWNDLPVPAAPQPLPDPPGIVDDEQIIGLLIEHGVSSTVAERTAGTLRRLRRLADWYVNIGQDLGEHEIRTFIVVPLLLALGWPEQRLRIEYKRADVALWDQPFNIPWARVQRIVETKRIYHALGRDSIKQAAAYADTEDACHSIIVTDGFRWKLFDRGEDEDGRTPWTATAYADIRRMRDRHPFDAQVGGADKLFTSLLP